MPADKNLILFTNQAATVAAITSPSLDIGMGGTPITHPLVARLFWSAASATATLTLTLEGSFDNTNWRQIGVGDIGVGVAAESQEGGVRFITRRRYVRGILSGAVVTGVTVALMPSSRSSPEMAAG